GPTRLPLEARQTLFRVGTRSTAQVKPGKIDNDPRHQGGPWGGGAPRQPAIAESPTGALSSPKARCRPPRSLSLQTPRDRHSGRPTTYAATTPQYGLLRHRPRSGKGHA